MKIKFITLISLALFIEKGIAQSVIKSEKSFSIPAETIRNDSFTYNLSNADTALAFVRNVILKRTEVCQNPDFNFFISDSLEQSAIIFLRHGLDATALLINKSETDLENLERNDIKKAKSDNIILNKELEKLNSLLLLIKFKNEVAESDYDSIVSFFSNMDTAFKLKDVDIPMLKSEKLSIIKNPKIKEIFSGILDEAKTALEKKQQENAKTLRSATPVFKENKEIVKMILHKRKGKFSDYILTTKKILIVILGGENDLQKAEISIKHNKSVFSQSFEDLRAALSILKGAGDQLPCKVILLKEKEIKPPITLSITQDSIKDIVLTIHEKNTATFQIGVMDNKFKFNNFSLANGNLVVKPDSAQKSNWKSNLYASIELHIPRDIDNFKPIYKTIFKAVDSPRTFGQWMYDITISRIGIYGGFKISDDPLSNIHAGFNYAISKELYVNFGWTWTNEVTPQVTKIGDINSLSDALKYAKRKYSKGQFCWGLSFAPTALIESLGLKKDDKKDKAKD